LASQRKMLRRRNEESKMDDAGMEAQFQKHIAAVKPWLARQPNMDVLYISYNALVSDPEPLCGRVVEFIRAPLNVSRMLAVPNAELYRNRISGM
ncbi:MAG TPA: hypothetical protein VK909_05375, partial [Anaerolineales bacterium]|nr:hypothetical protein [Anaerolineales bacterium]